MSASWSQAVQTVIELRERVGALEAELGQVRSNHSEMERSYNALHREAAADAKMARRDRARAEKAELHALALEAELAQLKQPAHVLAEAERLLREACDGAEVTFEPNGKICLHDGEDYSTHPSLAGAYAKLTGGRDAG